MPIMMAVQTSTITTPHAFTFGDSGSMQMPDSEFEFTY